MLEYKKVTKKVKNTAPWTNASNDLNGEGKEVIETFYEKKLIAEKSNQEKRRDFMLNGKDTTTCLIAG